MRQISRRKFGLLVLVLLFIATVTVGCSGETSAEPASGNNGYTGALGTAYENALDATSQLALGTLKLEGTENAVTEGQAAELLPLWEALQGNALQGQSERTAVVMQIEATLTKAQVAAIAALRLTQADAQAWLQDQGAAMPSGRQMPGEAASNMSEEERAAMREQFQAMSSEERAAQRERFAQQGGAASAPNGGTSRALLRAVVDLLTGRSGQAPAVAAGPARQSATPTPTPPTEPEAVVPTPTPEPTATPKVELTGAPEPAPTSTPTDATTSASASPAATADAGSAPAPAAAVQSAPAQIPDTDPGPPLVIEVTTNYAVPNPNLEGRLIYKVAGFVRNPTDQTYAVTAVHVTFYDADGFRGAFYPFPSRGGRGRPGGEYIWHGAVEADFACILLAPGEACPFTVEIAAQNMASFLVHPDAVVAEWHTEVPVTVSDVQVVNTGTSYVRIRGTVTNPNPFVVKNVIVSGVLLDGSGQMVSMGSGIVARIEAGASAPFDVRVEKQPFVSYQLYTQAEQSP